MGFLKNLFSLYSHKIFMPQKPAIEDKIAEFNKKIGERVRLLRKQKGYTSYESFAYEHGFHRAQVGQIENGRDMRLSTLFKILQALQITPQDFFSEWGREAD